MTNGQEVCTVKNAGQSDDSHPRQMEEDSVRFCHATQSSLQLKNSELFISGISHLIVIDHS